jgi:hypothetical protein
MNKYPPPKLHGFSAAAIVTDFTVIIILKDQGYSEMSERLKIKT